ncbi:Na+/H+ antiporter subunit D [Myxococcota bacterium]|nr:Na+/H+ antiporter subunit D [Myxococcota bacterium]
MWAVVLPLLVPFAGGLGTLALGQRPRARRVVSIVASAATLVASIALLALVREHGAIAVHAGAWAAPFGITLVADHLAGLLTTVTALVGLAVTLYVGSAGDDGEGDAVATWLHPLAQLLVMAVNGAFLAGDLFNLYVWFEVMLMASFAMLALGRTRAQTLRLFPYLAISLVASALFLAGVGVLYGSTGALGFSALASAVAAAPDAAPIEAAAVLLLLAFALKAGLFPLFTWLPEAYASVSTPIAALFAGLLTKVGVYAILRVFTTVLPGELAALGPWLVVVAGLTITLGVLAAVGQTDLRKILSFHIASQVGYMVLAVALATPLAIAAAIFYVVHHIVVKTNLFLLGGLIRRLGGTFELAGLGGLYAKRALVALLFAIPAASLAGLPPLSGFWAKLAVVRAGLEHEAYLAVAVAIGGGLLTLVSMTKIWGAAFWGEAKKDVEAPRLTGALAPITLLAATTIAIGLFAEPLFELSTIAAEELLRGRGPVLGRVP